MAAIIKFWEQNNTTVIKVVSSARKKQNLSQGKKSNIVGLKCIKVLDVLFELINTVIR